MTLAVGFVGIVALILIGVPVVAALGTVGLAQAWWDGLPLSAAAQSVYHGLDSFTLLAIPLFVLTGEILHRSGAAERLVRFVTMLVGWLPGGLGMSVVASTMLFSGLSGSVNADAAAIGSTMIPPMAKAGYRRPWAAAIVAAASGTGILIPPSITMIVLGTVAQISIRDLFLAALIPAAVVAVAKGVVIYFYAKYVEPTGERVEVTAAALGRAAVSAMLPLGAPVIILGGILAGIFTATEAAAVAVLYAVLLAVGYRSVSRSDWGTILVNAGRISGVVLSLVGVAQLLAFMLAYDQVGVELADWTSQFTGNYLVFVTILMILFWILGALLDGIPALVVLIPLFLPLAAQAGMGELHFAIFSLAVFGISLVTPPLGSASFIVTGLAKIRVVDLIRPMLPFMAVMFATILLLAYVPAFSEWLPSLVR
ncbi:TRAP transporter large permease [Paractinoplanes toevensis]|uniref:C4-dicarboxylate ABC transporter permease n=1 Tax=Paractinoplanes toevensis TaxID=571911 RepID=A0A919TAB8_9ACTN|nr:TRAP transporter large permease [Actinoplanes toevensis]GIM91066.1 C4-dicarboxylate ABC transporter permease [Actinoplanes toevensis]